MNNNHKSDAPAGMGLGDFLYVVFRHKYEIAFISLIGVAVACALPYVLHPKYASEAKLLIKYVVEGRNLPQVGGNQASVQPLDDSSSIINTELEILTSTDLALQVADAVGPEKILATEGGGSDRFKAAAVIQNPKNLVAESPRKSNVIRLSYQHHDPEIARTVLTQLIDSYIKKHAQIHKGGGFDEFLTQETDEIHNKLLHTEEELSKEKNKLGINSIDQAERSLEEQISKVREKLLDAQALLAEKEATVNELKSQGDSQAKNDTNTSALVVTSNAPPISPEQIAEYKSICTHLEKLQKREQDLLLTFTPASSPIIDIREQIVANDKLRRQFEEKNPGIQSVKTLGVKPLVTDPQTGKVADPVVSMAEVKGLQSKVAVLQTQLDDLQKRANTVNSSASSISELQRRRSLEEGYYTNFSESLEQSHISERLGSGKISNISMIQAPSPPGRVASKLRNMMAMALLGGIGGALGLAFLLEFFLDRSIKRPVDIENKLGLPFFLTIPRLSINGKARRLGQGNPVPALPAPNGDSEGNHSPAKTEDMSVALPKPPDMELAPWDTGHKLRPFSEALRDRLITWFEVNNLTHNPKLVAVTGCGEGSGVSTVAAGLAASLSETGEGNVLLVDMNVANGSAHHFYKGDLSCGIDEALEAGKRGSAQVQENLYVVSESNGGTEKLQSLLPTRFKTLVPKLKASDFDYIVFDMPAVNQVSMTPRLARFMDMVLLVVESEKTDLDIVKRASALLTSSKANVGVVLNKSRKYIPEWIQQEF